MNRVDRCTVLPLARIADTRGSLGFVEAGVHVPFDFKRVYYLYNIPAGSTRGAHGHRALQQLMIPMVGSFDVMLDDGRNRRRVHLNSPDQGLYICPMIWRDLENFSPDAVCMVIASEHYSEDDYFRDYVEFLTAVAQEQA